MYYCVQRAWKQGSKTARHNQGVGLLIQTHWRLMALRDRWYKWGMSLEQMSYVPRTNESWHRLNEMYMYESCHTYKWAIQTHWRLMALRDRWCEWVMSLERMRHVTYIYEPFPNYKWVMSRVRLSLVTLTNEPLKHIGVLWQEKQLSHVHGIAQSCRKVNETYI